MKVPTYFLALSALTLALCVMGCEERPQAKADEQPRPVAPPVHVSTTTVNETSKRTSQSPDGTTTRSTTSSNSGYTSGTTTGTASQSTNGYTSGTTTGTATRSTTTTEANDSSTVPAADNTAKNKVDSSGDTKTPMDQSESSVHIKTTADIRRAVMKEEGFSTNAQNCKIITDENGMVTLRGPVDSRTERDRIDAIAKSIAGALKVDNQLEIKLDSDKNTSTDKNVTK